MATLATKRHMVALGIKPRNRCAVCLLQSKSSADHDRCYSEIKSAVGIAAGSDCDVIDDLANEVVVKLLYSYGRRPHPHTRGTVSLVTVAKNVFNDYLRSEYARAKVCASADLHAVTRVDHEYDGGISTGNDHEINLLRKVLPSVPDGDLVVLYFASQLSLRQLAICTETPRSVLSRRIKTAKVQLADLMRCVSI